MVRRVGGTGRDFLVGTSTADFLFGKEENDTLLGGAGHDYLEGGTNDFDSDRIEGAAGNDVLFADNFLLLNRASRFLGLGTEQSFDDLLGGDGDDILIGGGDGGRGNDIIVTNGGDAFGGDGNDLLINGGEGGNGADVIVMTEAVSLISAGNGAWEDGAIDRIIIDGNFAGNITINGMDRADILEFRNVTGISSITDINIRKTIEDVFLTNLKTIKIRVDADTTLTIQGVNGGDIKYAINATNVDALINNINSRTIESRDANVKSLTTGNDRYSGLSGRDIVYAGAGNDTVNGGRGNDELQGQSGNDILSGGDGNDRLIGGIGRDRMSGGAGFDTFQFDSVSHIGKTATTRDIISDFTHRIDKIDLSTIDANGAAAGSTAFSFLSVKGAAFTGKAGQLRYALVGSSTLVEGDTNGDKVADFQIQLSGNKTLTASDFIL